MYVCSSARPFAARAPFSVEIERHVDVCRVQVYNARALVLEEFMRLMRKLTERRNVGATIKFRSFPEQTSKDRIVVDGR